MSRGKITMFGQAKPEWPIVQVDINAVAGAGGRTVLLLPPSPGDQQVRVVLLLLHPGGGQQ